MRGAFLAGGGALLVAVACSPRFRSEALQSDSAALAERAARFAEALAARDTVPARRGADRDPIARWVLPRRLTEISGLALTDDGRLLVHDDETARIVEIDYRRGAIVKSFEVGKPAIRGDFEGMTVMGDTVYLLASNGTIYRFREGGDGEQVPYEAHDTGLGAECEFEGIAALPGSRSLVLACKLVASDKKGSTVVLYQWSPGGAESSQPSRIAVPINRIRGAERWGELHPSDLAIDPESGMFVLVASRQRALIGIAPDGSGGWAEPLPGRHERTEGVAITRDRILILSDEGGAIRAAITLYRWP